LPILQPKLCIINTLLSNEATAASIFIAAGRGARDDCHRPLQFGYIGGEKALKTQNFYKAALAFLGG